jgi:enterochelin esterase family protein
MTDRKANPEASMNAEQVTIEGRDYTRPAWFLAGPRASSHALCVFLDGEFYLERAGALAVLEKATADGRIPSMSFAFVRSNGPQSRHEDLVCNERFAHFVAEDVLQWARNQLGSIRSEGNLVCGLSLSGLASAHAALKYPGVFSAALSQSGSFWWSDCRFAGLVRDHQKIGSRHWLSVGDEEIQEDVSHPPTGMHQGVSQIAGVQAAVDALTAAGAKVRHHVYRGGHAFDPWRDELTEALQWLVGTDQR